MDDDEQVEALRAERDALNKLMNTFEKERRQHNYDKRDYLDRRIRKLKGLEYDE